MEDIKVIICEDEFLLANDLKRQLESFGCRVTRIFRRGEELIGFLESKPPSDQPDAILMDICLAGSLSGIETARIVEGQSGAAIVFLSGVSEMKIMEETCRTKPHPFLLKPVDVQQALVSLRLAVYQQALESKIRDYRRRYGELVPC